MFGIALIRIEGTVVEDCFIRPGGCRRGNAPSSRTHRFATWVAGGIAAPILAGIGLYIWGPLDEWFEDVSSPPVVTNVDTDPPSPNTNQQSTPEDARGCPPSERAQSRRHDQAVTPKRKTNPCEFEKGLPYWDPYFYYLPVSREDDRASKRLSREASLGLALGGADADITRLS